MEIKTKTQQQGESIFQAKDSKNRRSCLTMKCVLDKEERKRRNCKVVAKLAYHVSRPCYGETKSNGIVEIFSSTEKRTETDSPPVFLFFVILSRR